jgi:hypothetical protein
MGESILEHPFNLGKLQQFSFIYGDVSKPWYLVNPKIAGIYGCSSHSKCIYRYWPIPILRWKMNALTVWRSKLFSQQLASQSWVRSPEIVSPWCEICNSIFFDFSPLLFSHTSLSLTNACLIDICNQHRISINMISWFYISNFISYIYWLVVWNMAFMFFHSVGNFIIPTDFHSIIFQRGRYTTNQLIVPSASSVRPGATRAMRATRRRCWVSRDSPPWRTQLRRRPTDSRDPEVFGKDSLGRW